MSAKTITVHVKMDPKTLRAFSLFDTFRLKKQWKRPVLFGAILIAFAIVCFLTGKAQSAMIGSLLLIIGLGLPFVYVSMFLSQVKEQAKKMRLKPPRRVYSLAFTPEKITVTNDMKKEETVTLEWDKLAGVFRVKKAMYLYATRTRAFILPNGQADAPDGELWALIASSIPQGRAFDWRKHKR